MEHSIATVLSTAKQSAVVAVASAPCQRCLSGRGCGAGVFGRSSAGPKQLVAALPVSISVTPGDCVRLSFDERRLLIASACLYGLPLAGLLLAAAVAQLLSMPSDGYAALLGLAGIAAGASVARRLSRSRHLMNGAQPVVTARLSRGSDD